MAEDAKSVEQSAKAKLMKRLGGEEKKPEPAGLNVSLTGFPPLDAIVEALGTLAQTVSAQSEKMESMAGQIKAMGEQLQAQTQHLGEIIGLQKTANEIQSAPVVPTYDEAGNITSAHRDLTKEKAND